MTNKYAGQQYETSQVHYLRKKITFADVATVVSLGWVPEGASVIRGGVHVTTAFDAGAKTLDIGFRNAPGGETDDPNAYATLLTLAAVGVIPADEMAAVTAVDLTKGGEITCSPVSIAATAGAATVWMEYIVDNDGDVTS
jgi:hypothetical protein